MSDANDTERTVFVVMSRKSNSTHPFCEAVYDNEEAAREHWNRLAASLDVVAWDVHERTVLTNTKHSEGSE